MNLKTLLLGKMATHCAECGVKVIAATEFRVPPIQVYCSEAHAAEYQQNNPI
ncbi:hypothetical protein [Marisediminicola sp. LYQ134]|uniref:hypothetical protein n=1 Tax=Marisediminicola sp. LYQ134 TaxID=3391061 RepID=UPI003983202C